ncbi:MAG: DUF5113 domain-containing protein [Bacteroidaceae bacterium]|nr:DUF5113 domain-containing protein [Bacteroidaceae bacterium]
MRQIVKNIRKGHIGTLMIVLISMFLPVKNFAKPLREQTGYFLDKAYSYIAVNIDSAEYYADMVCSINRPQSAPYSKAKNIKAKVEFSRMHYLHSANQYLAVIENSRNQLDVLEAEVGLMKVYQRTSDNISFYQYRNSALKRMQSIQDESDKMDETDLNAFQTILRDFRSVSALYFYELEQINQSDKEYEKLMADPELRYDVPAFLMSLYLKGLGIGVDRTAMPAEQLVERARSLNDCLRYAERIGNQRLQAMSLRATAVLLVEADAEEINLLIDAGDILESVNKSQIQIELLPVQLLSRAMQIFAANGCIYDMIECHRILASVYILQDKYEDALKILEQSLSLFNDVRTANYPDTRNDSLQLQLYRDDYLNVEELWIDETPYATVPESMSSIREQISLAYSGLGDKVASDYNRNVYIELQKTIRLDRRYEARNELLKRSNRQLSLVIVVLIVLSLTTIYVYRKITAKLKLKNKEYAERLIKIYNLCTEILNISSGNKEIIVNLNSEIIPQAEELIGTKGLSIIQDNGAVETSAYVIPLVVSGTDKIVAYMVADNEHLQKEQKILLNIIAPYITSVLVNLGEYEWQQEYYNEIVEQHNIYTNKADNNKCENLKRKTYCSVVAESLPYIDRMKAEIMRLSSDSLNEERIRYISELVERINGYNNLLTNWVQMRQGMVTLSIESFALQDLFDIVFGSSASFRNKGIKLIVPPTDAVVRADKSLTLFMINTLAENARKFTEPGGEVTVAAQQYDEYVEISVSDTGIGLSEEDVRTIRETKIYNSSKKNGFGLINCKGIIDKYRKTDHLFDVCSFDVESTLGKGSRFFFRLPKGVKRILSVLLMLLPCSAAFSASTDSLLNKAYLYAEQAYLMNVESCYEEALLYADSALACLNMDYIANTGDSLGEIYLYGKDYADETVWLESGFATDYETLLWIRNEVAISALALGDWELYNYNNNLYLKQFKLYYAEHNIEQDSLRLQRNNSTLSILLVLIVLLFVVLLVSGFLLHVKYLIRYRSDMQQVLSVMDKISESATVQNQQEFNVREVIQKVVNNIVYDIDQMVPIRNLSVIIKGTNGVEIAANYGNANIVLDKLMETVLKQEQTEPYNDDTNYLFPLTVNTINGLEVLGVMGISIKKDTAGWQEQMVLIVQYLAATLRSTILRFELVARNIEQIQEESERIKYEDNQLHVRNLVLDNSLSTLKHETVYYPNRIKHLLSLQQTSENREADIDEMQELVSYYRDIYAILSHNVISQTGDNIVNRKNIEVNDIIEYAQKIAKKDTVFNNTAHLVMADETLLKYLVKLLMDRISEHSELLSVTVKEEYGFVKFAMLSSMNSDQKTLDTLFHPLNNKDDMAYVLCRQIIREHDDMFNHIGCRINAESVPGGTLIWFTLPAVME